MPARRWPKCGACNPIFPAAAFSNPIADPSLGDRFQAVLVKAEF